jgi:putative transposase
LLKDSPLKDGEDVNALMREMMAEVLEGSFEGELEEESGYTRHDYRNKRPTTAATVSAKFH